MARFSLNDRGFGLAPRRGPAGAQGVQGQPGLLPAWIDVKAAPYNAAGDGSTDDTAAIQAAIDACATAGGGTVYFPAGVYIIGGALQTTHYSVADYNAQLCLPFDGGTGGPLPITLLGPTPASVLTDSNLPGSPKQYAILKSTLTGATGTDPAMLATRQTEVSFGLNNITLRNLGFRCPTNPTLGAVNLKTAWAHQIHDCAADAGEAYSGTLTQPTHPKATGFVMSTSDTSTPAYQTGNLYVQGFYSGVKGGNHVHFEDIECHGCYIAYNPMSTNDAPMFTPHIDRLAVWDCPYGIAYADSTGLVDIPNSTYLSVDRMYRENLPGSYGAWTARVADVWDQFSGGVGARMFIDVGITPFNSGPWPPVVQGYNVNYWLVGADHSLFYTLAPADYLNSWHYTTTYNSQQVSVYMDRSGRVFIQGSIDGGTPGTTAFTLPRPFRPLANYYSGIFPCGHVTGTTYDSTAVYVDAGSGNVQPQGGMAYMNFSYLSADRMVGDQARNSYW